MALREQPPPDHQQSTARLIINGDDFGYSDAINAAIMHCHHDGALTSATILVNQPASRAALALARVTPALGVGLHLNLTDGVPVSLPESVPTLVDRRGRFLSISALLRDLATGQVALDDVAREFRAQHALMIAGGVAPTHVDGHLHVHALPRILPLTLALLAEWQVRAMRSPLLAPWLPTLSGGSPWQVARDSPRPARLATTVLRWRPLLARLRRLGPVVDRRHAALLDDAGIIRATHLLDAGRFVVASDPVAALLDAIGPLRGSLIEIMAHPGWNRDAQRGSAEVALLTNQRLRAALDERGIVRLHYGLLGTE